MNRARTGTSVAIAAMLAIAAVGSAGAAEKRTAARPASSAAAMATPSGGRQNAADFARRIFARILFVAPAADAHGGSQAIPATTWGQIKAKYKDANNGSGGKD